MSVLRDIVVRLALNYVFFSIIEVKVARQYLFLLQRRFLDRLKIPFFEAAENSTFSRAKTAMRHTFGSSADAL